MLNNILKIEGAQGLSSIEQKEVKGGGGVGFVIVTQGYCKMFQGIVSLYIKGGMRNNIWRTYIYSHGPQYHACLRKHWIFWGGLN
jgi:hypothetical protein